MVLRSIVVLAALCGVSVAADIPPEITQRARGDGTVFTNERGMTLYVNDRDTKPDVFACVEACVETWPILKAPEGAKDGGLWAVAKRPDGSLQWRYRGKPLHLYVRDAAPGTAFGDSVAGPWHAAFEPMPTPPQVTIARTTRGQVLADTAGRALFSVTSEKECDDDCKTGWRQVRAPRAASSHGEWSVLRHQDGTTQWAYAGRPLYYRDGDPIDDRRWQPLVLEPPSPRPAWVTTTKADVGELYTDAGGRTLYRYSGDAAKIEGKSCDATCMARYWQPLLAAPNAKPAGDWSVIPSVDGKLQWAYRGAPLFTYADDTQPGNISGINFRGGRGWDAILVSGQAVQGQ